MNWVRRRIRTTAALFCVIAAAGSPFACAACGPKVEQYGGVKDPQGVDSATAGADSPGTDKLVRLVSNGLAVAAAPSDASATYGWNAVVSGIDGLAHVTPTAFSSTLAEKIEIQAVAKGTGPALEALEHVYRHQANLRRRMITSWSSAPGPDAGPAPENAFWVAVVAEAQRAREGTPDSLPSVAPPVGATSDDDTAPLALPIVHDKRFLARLIKLRANAVPPEALRQSLGRALASHGVEDTLAILLVASMPEVRRALTLDIGVLAEILAYLEERAVRAPAQAIERLLSAAARDASEALRVELEPSLGMENILRGAILSPVSRADALAPQQIVVTPQSSTVRGKTNNGIGNGTTPSVVAISPVRPIAEYFGGPTPGVEGYRCLAASGSPLGAGSCFDEVTRTLRVADTPGPTLAGLGIVHRTWANFGSGAVRYAVRVGFKPSTETNWVAVRISGTGGATSPTCTSGCYTPGATASTASPLSTEPGTRWSIYAVVQGKTLDLLGDDDAVATVQNGFFGFGSAPDQQLGIEILPFDTANSATFPAIDVLVLTEPVKSNGLLTYAAALQRALNDGQWLAPVAADTAAAGGYALARLQKLHIVVELNLPPIPGGPTGVMAPSRERQAFLKGALPIVAHRVFDRYGARLETETALIAAGLPTVRKAHAELIRALEVLDSLSVTEANTVLTRAGDVLGLGGGLPLQQLELLLAAIVGARHALRDHQQSQEHALSIRCALLRRFSYSGAGGTLPILPSPQVMKLCDSAELRDGGTDG